MARTPNEWKRLSPQERFEMLHIPEPNSGCWLWIGGTATHGYGRIMVKGRRIGAHRYSYELHKGPIPEGLQIDHLCRTRSCVNPDHLEAVTGRTNVLRGNTVVAENARKTHCSRGHLFSGRNLSLKIQDGRIRQRLCKACAVIATQEWRQRNPDWRGRRAAK